MRKDALATRVDKWPACAGLLYQLSYAAVIATVGLEPATDMYTCSGIRRSIQGVYGKESPRRTTKICKWAALRPRMLYR